MLSKKSHLLSERAQSNDQSIHTVNEGTRSTGRTVFLTFDVEDFVNEASLVSLMRILRLLEKNSLRGLFFITGTMAEKIAHYPKVLESFKNHQIGYHSSSHSVAPRICQFTDVKSYRQAVEISLTRESSRIDPLTGEIKGRGGLLYLRKLFPEHEVASFRAPQLCWSPPHLQALRLMGIMFDFSAALCDFPVSFRETTFYPYPTPIDGVQDKLGSIRLKGGITVKPLIKTILRRRFTVLSLHPHSLSTGRWDSLYMTRNGFTGPEASRRRGLPEYWINFVLLELLLFALASLKALKILEVNPPLRSAKTSLKSTRLDVGKIYETNMKYSRMYFSYEPRSLYRHFQRYFSHYNRSRSQCPVGA